MLQGKCCFTSWVFKIPLFNCSMEYPLKKSEDLLFYYCSKNSLKVKYRETVSFTYMYGYHIQLTNETNIDFCGLCISRKRKRVKHHVKLHGDAKKKYGGSCLHSCNVWELSFHITLNLFPQQQLGNSDKDIQSHCS